MLSNKCFIVGSFSRRKTSSSGMGKEMMTMPRFKKSIMNSDAVLRPYGVELHKLLTEGLDDDFNDTVNSFVGIAAIQVNLTITCGKCITYVCIKIKVYISKLVHTVGFWSNLH
jgi:hypothetical protein